MKNTFVLLVSACVSILGLSSCTVESNNYNQNEVIEYVVSFETNGGTPVSSKTGTVYSSPSTTREGYTFLGWYEDKSLTRPVSFPYTPDDDVTLYAKWEKQLTDKEKLINHGKITLNPTVQYGTCTITLEYYSSSDQFKMTVSHNSPGSPLYYRDNLSYTFSFGLFGYGSGSYSYTDLYTSTNGSFTTNYSVTYSNSAYTFSFSKTGLMSEQRQLVTSCFQQGYVHLDTEIYSLYGFYISH